MTVRDVTWPLDPHTKGKHDLEAFRRHASRIRGEAVFLFIEENADTAAHLRKVLESQRPLPRNCKYEVAASDFETTMTSVLDSLKTGRIAPAFMMLDPFGVTGMPMSRIARLIKSGKTELYITFMYEFIDRIKKTAAFEMRLTELYGTQAWKDGLALEGRAKQEFFFGLYKEQLLKAGARYVLRFDLYRDGHLVYGIFFATKHWKGADVMKWAIWKVAPFGDFAFRSALYDQLILGVDTVDYSPLRTSLLEEFKGKGPVSIERIEPAPPWVHGVVLQTHFSRFSASQTYVHVTPPSIFWLRFPFGSYMDLVVPLSVTSVVADGPAAV